MSRYRFGDFISLNQDKLSQHLLRVATLGSQDDNIILTKRVITLPNGVTIARALLVVFAVWLIVATNHWLLAFCCLWLAAFLDSVDGYLARRLNQVSQVGALLDPAVDRLAMTAVTATLAFTHFIPIWIFAVTAARDLAVTSLSIVLAYRRRLISVSLTGKLGTMILFLAFPLSLLRRTWPGASPWLLGFSIALAVLGLGLYYLSLLQYVQTARAVSAKG